MGFADAYLLKAGLREAIIQTDPHSDLKIMVAIPVTNESGLEKCLDSLFMAAAPIRTEVLILVNAAASATPAVVEQNLSTLSRAREWIATHHHPWMDFHIWLDHSFGRKEAGVGMARKILMDEAVRRLSVAGNPRGIIASLDADAQVDPNYLRALLSHFSTGSNDGPDGCSICFEHPLEGKEFPPGVYDAITRYELHLRYYLAAVRSTGYPHAYQTVGSAFAVRAGIYCMEGGMNRRKGGEDFYFIQKVAQRGNWSECNATRVVPSPRPSDRVPFGTGRAVQQLIRDADPSGAIPPLKTYHPEPFGMLRELFSGIDALYREPLRSDHPTDDSGLAALGDLPGVLMDFLSLQGFRESLSEIRENCGSIEAFRKRFWRWFHMFRIMKFLHYARDHGYPDVETGDAARRFLSLELGHSNRELLEIFRNRER
ncbi:MAG: hypothetical protein R6W31_06470 [Bacteroidales bacterium]